MPAGDERRHIPELDGLRALAVVAVVLFHSAPSGPVSGGFLGVDLFFVLSAFLITSILHEQLHRRGSIDLRGFYLRRLLRLTPALLLLLAVYLVAAPLIWPAHNHLRDAALTALYLSDYSYAFQQLPFYLQHSWSLSVEEHFYLLWPLLLPAIVRLRLRWTILLLGYVALCAWRISFGDSWQDYYYRFDTRATGLVAGILLYFALPGLSLRPIHAYFALAVLVILAAMADISDAATYIPLAEAASAILIACAATGAVGLLGPILRSTPAVTLGKLSYGIYLWHFPFAFWAREQWGFAATAVAALVFAVVAATISHVTVESWGRRAMRPLTERRRQGGDHVASRSQPGLPG